MSDPHTTVTDDVVVFGGPSLPPQKLPRVRYLPAAARGAFDECDVRPGTIVLLLDIRFLDVATISHAEICRAVKRGWRIFGAASGGALRAVEMRSHGMVGLGQVYQAFLSGALCDDGELAMKVCPMSGRPLTVALVTVRSLLAGMTSVNPAARTRALTLAQQITFLERSPPALLRAWREVDISLEQQASVALSDQMRDIKVQDAVAAIDFVAALAAGRPLPIDSTSPKLWGTTEWP